MRPYREIEFQSGNDLDQIANLRLQARKEAQERYESIRDHLPGYAEKCTDELEKVACQIQTVRDAVMQEIRQTLSPETEVRPAEAVHMIFRHVFDQLKLKPPKNTTQIIDKIVAEIAQTHPNSLKIDDFESLMTEIVDALLKKDEILRKVKGTDILEPEQPNITFQDIIKTVSDPLLGGKLEELSKKILQETITSNANPEFVARMAREDESKLLSQLERYNGLPNNNTHKYIGAVFLIAQCITAILLSKNPIIPRGLFILLEVLITLVCFGIIGFEPQGGVGPLETKETERKKILEEKIPQKTGQIYKLLNDIHNLFLALAFCKDNAEQTKQIREKILILLELIKKLQRGEKLESIRGNVKIDFTKLFPELDAEKPTTPTPTDEEYPELHKKHRLEGITTQRVAPIPAEFGFEEAEEEAIHAETGPLTQVPAIDPAKN